MRYGVLLVNDKAFSNVSDDMVVDMIRNHDMSSVCEVEKLRGFEVQPDVWVVEIPEGTHKQQEHLLIAGVGFHADFTAEDTMTFIIDV